MLTRTSLKWLLCLACLAPQPACIPLRVPAQYDTSSALVETLGVGDGFDIEGAETIPSLALLGDSVRAWLAATDGGKIAVTGGGVLGRVELDGGRYHIHMWRPLLGDEVSGEVPGFPLGKSNDHYLICEAERRRSVLELSTWRSIPIPDDVSLHVSRSGRWVGVSAEAVTGGVIRDGSLEELFRLAVPDAVPQPFTMPHHGASWLADDAAAVLTGGAVVWFEPAQVTTLEVGAILGVVHGRLIVHVDDSGRRLSATDAHSGVTTRLDHDRVGLRGTIIGLSPSGHFAVARSEGWLPGATSDKLVHIKQFPAWGTLLKGRRAHISEWEWSWIVIPRHPSDSPASTSGSAGRLPPGRDGSGGEPP